MPEVLVEAADVRRLARPRGVVLTRRRARDHRCRAAGARTVVTGGKTSDARARWMSRRETVGRYPTLRSPR
jgi:hypothetical protein